MQQLLNEILDEVRPLVGCGKVADYIPALAGVEPNQLGIVVYSRDDELFHTGDAPRPFSIQSISRAFSLIQAIQHFDEDIWQHLGHESPSQPLNSLMQLESERGKSRSPFTNVGALMIYDIDQSCFAAPVQSMRDFVRRLCDNSGVVSDSVVARLEYQHCSRNAATAYLMKPFSNFHNDIGVALLSYLHRCALRTSYVDLARTFCFLVDKSFCKHGGEQVPNERRTKQVNATMTANGLYDGAGNFAYRVGLSDGSGVGDGIVAVVPGRFTVCVQSPELNIVGNSLTGIAALEKLSERTGRSVF